MNYTTRINYGEWKNGDVLCFQQNSSEDTPNYDIICKVVGDKLIEIPTDEDIFPNENWDCLRINYKFISDGTWYLEGTEAYPTHEIDGDWALFQGYTDESYVGYDGELPRWDGETCSLDEFEIIKRVNF